MTRTVRKTPDAFKSGAHIYDWHSGHKAAPDYDGEVLIGSSVFRTYKQDGERHWRYLMEYSQWR